MARNVLKLLFAVICIFWIIGIAIVPNPRFCIGGCSGDDFWPLIIINGYLFALIPNVYLSWYVTKEFKLKRLKNFFLNFLIISVAFLVTASILHKEELFGCYRNTADCPWGNVSSSPNLER